MRACKNAGRIAVAVFAGAMPVLAGATGGQDQAPVPARQRELVHPLRQDCGSCHGLSLKGGLGPALTPQALRSRTPGSLVATIEFTPRGEAVWISARDDDRIVVYDTATLRPLSTLAVDGPSGIFFTARAARIGF